MVKHQRSRDQERSEVLSRQNNEELKSGPRRGHPKEFPMMQTVKVEFVIRRGSSPPWASDDMIAMEVPN